MSVGGVSTFLLLQNSDPSRGWIGTWSPGIGDPTFVGWITVLAYLAASYLCWRVFRRLREQEPTLQDHRGPTVALIPLLLALLGKRRRLSSLPVPVRLGALWLGLALVLLFLAVNKQLDLQTVITETGRILAHREGWYSRRQLVQVVFIGSVGLAGVWAFGAILLLARGSMRPLRGVLAGTVFIICFVAIRASSFHHVDALLGYRFAGFKMNWILELGGIAFIGLGAYRNGALASRGP